MRWSNQDYAITHVRYDDDETSIVKVKQREVIEGGEELDSPQVRTKSAVIKNVDVYNNDYVTSTHGSNGWKLGEEVHVVEANGEKWLRTDPNETPEDNLGSLPTF
ncbi:MULTISPECIES: DUF3892 domain-containing protein [Haloferacaceae]|uniref:DUF3892 domain-containing protein n=1 Tax=Halorubrum glutamatedens TaxID=2707018 RepID=A0ABD5QWW1_9EURY|nr:DUF3892 domain-containing protein [Halobellus captivus]